MIINSPNAAEYKRAVLKYADMRERERQRLDNIQRLIAYNNRRVLAGLRPLDMPSALLDPAPWNMPGNRDRMALLKR